MTAEKTFRAIPGGDALLEWFEGLPTFRTKEGVPDFHDAEILALDLDREGPARLVLRTWIFGQLQPGGQLPLRHECTVTLLLLDVFDLDLKGFGRQNVIGRLTLSCREFSGAEMASLPGKVAGPGYEIDIEPCWGLSGTIRCRSLEVEFKIRDLAN